MKNFFKGFIIGIGKIIPGVSGAMLAIIMGVYDKALFYLNNFKDNKKEGFKYLLPIGIGIIIAIIFFSKIIHLLLSKYYLMTMLFFIGLIVGGIPFTMKKVDKKEYYVTIITFILFFLISITNINNSYVIRNDIVDMIIFMLSGILEAFGTVVPGISSTALLLIMGTYNVIIYSIGNIMDFSLFLFNLKILIPFTFGLIIGIIILIKIVNIVFKKYQNKMYAFILGVLFSSIVLLIIKAFSKEVNGLSLLGGILFMILGIFISSLMEEK